MPQYVGAGDIGATNTTMAVCVANTGKVKILHQVSRPTPRVVQEIGGVFKDWLSSINAPTLLMSCFAVAGAVKGNQVDRFVNLSGSLSGLGLATTLEHRVELVNDTESFAYGLDQMDYSALQEITLEGFKPFRQPCLHVANTAILAAGTGLGEAVRIISPAGTPVVVATEGSHAEFGPDMSDIRQIRYLEYLSSKYGPHVSWERAASGQALVDGFEFLTQRGGLKASSSVVQELECTEDKPAIIAKYALADEPNRDRACLDSAKLLVSCLGAEAGNLALKINAKVVLLGGGVAAKLAPLLTPLFPLAFRHKGRQSWLMKEILLYLDQDSRKTTVLGAAGLAMQLATFRRA